MNSKTIPDEVREAFSEFSGVYYIHSEIIRRTLPLCVYLYRNGVDPNLKYLAKLMLSASEKFQRYIEFEIKFEWRIQQINFWRRFPSHVVHTENSMGYAYLSGDIPDLGVYQNEENLIGKWFEECEKNKDHSLETATEYLKLPWKRLEEYQKILKALSPISRSLHKAWAEFQAITKEFNVRFPIASEVRRIQELDGQYGLTEEFRRNGSSMGIDRFLGDAVILLKSETFLEEPQKNEQANVIHYTCPNFDPTPYDPESDKPDNLYAWVKKKVAQTMGGDTSNFNIPIATAGTYGTGNNHDPDQERKSRYDINTKLPRINVFPIYDRSAPVSKVLQKVRRRTRYEVPLYRVIIFEKAVIFVISNKENRGVFDLKFYPRERVSASLFWDFPNHSYLLRSNSNENKDASTPQIRQHIRTGSSDPSTLLPVSEQYSRELSRNISGSDTSKESRNIYNEDHSNKNTPRSNTVRTESSGASYKSARSDTFKSFVSSSTTASGGGSKGEESRSSNLLSKTRPIPEKLRQRLESAKKLTHESGLIRIIFHDEPRLWSCVLRTVFTPKKHSITNQRDEFVSLLSLHHQKEQERRRQMLIDVQKEIKKELLEKSKEKKKAK